MDSVGIGALPDAAKYGDEGSDTFGHIALSVPEFSLPHLEQLGLGNIDGIKHMNKCDSPAGSFARMIERSCGKDTIVGHWELAGITLSKPLKLYPNGFPAEFIRKFESMIGTKVIGNIAASGTEIMSRLGMEHVKTGCPIVYTSADSVFQIAAHEGVIPTKELYDMCKIARRLLSGKNLVGRVIARPFISTPDGFERTSNRRDFSIHPPKETILSYIEESGGEVIAIGKISDIFAGEGITTHLPTVDNMDGVVRTIKCVGRDFRGMIFTNLVDFDTKYGHRNDVVGYAKALEEFDARIQEITSVLHDEDVLIITADHGCDPTTEGTNHSREYVPLLVYGKRLKSGINLGTRKSFSDVAATIADHLGIDQNFNAQSFYRQIT